MALAALALSACASPASVVPMSEEPSVHSPRGEATSAGDPETEDPSAWEPASEPASEPARGRIEALGRFGDDRHAERSVRIWLPPGHDPAVPRPVLYVFDGGAERELRIAASLEALLATEQIEPWIVVLIDSTEERQGELALDAESMGAFVLERIEPALAGRLALREGPEARALLGFSFGGLCALRVGLSRPERFGRVVAMSPSLWWRQRQLLRRLGPRRGPGRRPRGALPRRLWIDVGALEGEPADRVPYMVHDARALRDAMLDRGLVFGRQLGYLEAPGEDHSFEAAGRRMRAALAFALGERDLSFEGPESMSVALLPAPPREPFRVFSVEARYLGGLRLSWPAELLELEVVGGPRRRSGRYLGRRGEGRLIARLPELSGPRAVSSPGELSALPAP